MREALALAFLLSAQGSVARCVRDHHLHHRYSDQPGDPHSPHLGGGFWEAHLGWLWRRPPTRAETGRLYLRWTRRLEAGRVGRYFTTGPRLAALHLGFASLCFALGPPWAAFAPGPRCWSGACCCASCW